MIKNVFLFKKIVVKITKNKLKATFYPYLIDPQIRPFRQDVVLHGYHFHKHLIIKKIYCLKDLPLALVRNSTVFNSLLQGSNATFILNNDSISVVLPIPVSPTHKTLY